MPPEKSTSGTLREWLYIRLEHAPGRRLTGINAFIVLLIIVSVVLGIVGTEPAVQRAMGDVLLYLELILGTFFVVELGVRTWVAGVDPRFAGVAGMLRYLRRPLSLIDMIVVISLFAPLFGGEFVILRLLRVLRLVALAKFGRYSIALRRLSEAFSARRYELLMSLVIASLVFLFAATGMYLFESAAQPEAFGSIPRALWWSVITLTTVGYGDIYPLTTLGKLFAGLMAIAGIGIIAMPTGILAAAFSEAAESNNRGRDGRTKNQGD